MAFSALRGGSLTIDLGELDESHRTTHDEVTIEISNTASVQYQLLQVLSSPLVNERGATLDASSVVIEMQESPSGTVRFRGASPMPAGTTELFISDANGQRETLQLLYGLVSAALPQAGTYVGAIAYTLQTVDGSSVKISTVPIRLTVQPIVSLSVAPGSDDRLRFPGLEPGQVVPPQRLVVLIARNTAEPIQVTQSVEEPLVNERGDALPLSALSVSAASEGVAVPETAVTPRMTMLASEAASGASRRLELSYHVTVPPDQRAGVYRGLLRLALVGGSAAAGGAVGLALPIEMEVLQVLSLSVGQAAGESLALQFQRLERGEASDPQTLQFEIRANTGKPYGVFQELSHILVTDEGRQLGEGSFTCAGAGASGPGTSQLAAEQPVPLGKSLIFQSDPSGSPTTFSVVYRVSIPKYAAAGVYRSSLVFIITPL